MILGIDLGGMSAKAACVSRGKIKGESFLNTDMNRSPEETASDLVKLSFATARNVGTDFNCIEAVGVGAPGIIDSRRGIVVSWANFGWKNVPLADMLSRRLKKPVFILNDANAAALGEAKFGAGKKYKNTVLLTLGTGVGAGIILNGKIFQGLNGAGAELGHTVLVMNGKPCSCGRKGCFECYVSTRALIDRVREEMEKAPDGMLASIARQKGLDGKTLFVALEKKDKTAIQIFEEYIKALGEGVLNIVNFIRPEAIVIGGGISAQGETLLKPLREYVYEKLKSSLEYAPLAIIAAQLKNRAGIIGAAEFARLEMKKFSKKDFL